MFIVCSNLHFFVLFLKRFFTRSHRIRIIFKKIYLTHNGFGEVIWFKGTSTLDDHLLPNSVYSRYHIITDVCTTALLLTKPSSDDDSGFRHSFGTEASLPLAQSAPAVSHDTTRLCQIVVTLWDCHIHADAVRALSWIFSMYFLLSDGGSPRLVKKTEVELAMKPLHPTSMNFKWIAYR